MRGRLPESVGLGLGTGSNCPRCGYVQGVPAPTCTCTECGLSYDSQVGPSRLRYSDPHWLGQLLFGCRLIQRCLFVLLCCVLVAIFSGLASHGLRQWNAPAWSFQVLSVLLWGMVIALFLAVGSLMIGLVGLFAVNPYEEFSWMSATRRWINYISVPALGLWVLAVQSDGGASAWGTWVPIGGAVVLSAHAIAVLHLTVALKSRCADGPHRRVASLGSVAIASFVCSAIFVTAMLERETELLRVIWAIWVVAVGFSSRSLGPKLQHEMALHPDGASRLRSGIAASTNSGSNRFRFGRNT